jgi:hypothetical protein
MLHLIYAPWMGCSSSTTYQVPVDFLELIFIIFELKDLNNPQRRSFVPLLWVLQIVGTQEKRFYFMFISSKRYFEGVLEVGTRF